MPEFRRTICLLGTLLTSSCQVVPSYAPAPIPVLVESVEVLIVDFHGRPDAHAIVKGRLSSTAAQLVDSEQSRSGNHIALRVLEQTPRGATLLPTAEPPPAFETKIPIDLLGLSSGSHTLVANGVATTFEISDIQAQAVESASIAVEPTPPRFRLLEEFIPPGVQPAAPQGVGRARYSGSVGSAIHGNPRPPAAAPPAVRKPEAPKLKLPTRSSRFKTGATLP